MKLSHSHSRKIIYFFLPTLFIFAFICLYGANNAYSYARSLKVTKIISVRLNRGILEIYSEGIPRDRQYEYGKGHKNFFIVELSNAILYGHGKKISGLHGNVRSVSYSQFSLKPNYSVHIVFREKIVKKLRIRTVKKGNNRYELIINVSGKNGYYANKTKSAKLTKYKRRNRERHFNFKVFIDAGHGGGDPGGIGPMGLPENFVNLSIALELKKMLEAKGIEAEIDRTSNTYLSLRNRAVMANRSGGNLFIGLYCNAAVVPYVYGTTTYYYRRDSYGFARFLEHYISSKFNLKYDGVLRDDLYVLRFVSIPSVVIEYAYISNPYEEHLLASSTFRHLLANGIANAIYKYYILKKR